MKKKASTIKKIKLGYSCTEDWNTMQQAGKNKHCDSCNKLVYDFSGLSNEEAIQFLEDQQGNSICGKFAPNQMNSINRQLGAKDHGVSRLATQLVLSGALLASLQVGAQNTNNPHYKVVSSVQSQDTLNKIVVAGKVEDEYGQELPFVNVFVRSLNLGAATDFDGKFTLELPDTISDQDELNLSFIGMEPMVIKLVDIKNKEVKIVMKADEITMQGLIGVVYVEIPWYKRIWYNMVDRAYIVRENLSIRKTNLPVEQVETKPIAFAEQQQEAEPLWKLSAYPNPTTDAVTISVYLPDTYQTGHVTLYDATGKQIKTYNVIPGNNLLTVEQQTLTKGIYFCTFTADGEVLTTERIVKQ